MNLIPLNIVELFDMGFGPHLISVTPPGVPIARGSSLKEPGLGKAPGILTNGGWTSMKDWGTNPKYRVPDYKTAKHLLDQGANAGFVAGENGYAFIDNDQGSEFSDLLQEAFLAIGVTPLRRGVLHPNHKRDAFLIQVHDGLDLVNLRSQHFVLRQGVKEGKLQVIGVGAQAVVSGIHRDTLAPYGWDRKFESIAEIPLFSEDQLRRLFEVFQLKCAAAGWQGAPIRIVSSTVSSVSSKPGVPIATPGVPIATGQVDRAIAEAGHLLSQMPNDKRFDLYDDWIAVAYMLAANLGDAVKMTPEAEALWVEWSNQQDQNDQDPVDAWRSVIRQPDLRFGQKALWELARSLGVAPEKDFSADPKLTPLSTPEYDALQERYAVFTKKTGFYDMRTNTLMSGETFSNIHRPKTQLLLGELWRDKRKPTPNPDLGKLFSTHPRTRVLLDITYAPGDPAFINVVGLKNSVIFNKWKPPEFLPLPTTELQVKPWLDHVEFMLGSAERDRFAKWCAFITQFPQLKPNWGWLVMSRQGIGKDTLLEPMKIAVGPVNYQTAPLQLVIDTFNKSVETKLLMISETAQSNPEAKDAQNRLKGLLAAPPDTITINEKNIPRYDIPNRVAVIMFSNEAKPVYLDREQRRLHVINSQGVQRKPDSYYASIWNWLKADGANLVASYLFTYPLSAADKQLFAGNAPESDDKTALEQRNMNPVEAGLNELIQDARAGMGPFTSLLADVGQLAQTLKNKGYFNATPHVIKGYLSDMEKRGEGVRRLKVNPKHPGECSPISDKKGKSARLWCLGEKTPDGRPWSDFTEVQILAMWEGKTLPSSATILQYPAVNAEGDEII